VAYELVSEVLDFAPADVTSAELVVLLAIADGARRHDRPGRPARTWDGDLAVAARIKPGSLGRVLQRLRDRDLEVRVPVRVDTSGRHVYAHPGRHTTYRLPDLERDARQNGRTSVRPLIDRQRSDGRTSVRAPGAEWPDTRPAMAGPQSADGRTEVRPNPVSPVTPAAAAAAEPVDNHDAPAAPGDVDDQLADVRERLAAELHAVLLEQRHGARLSAARSFAPRLAEAGWTPETLTTALADEKHAGPAELGQTIKGLISNGPPKPVELVVPTSTRCPVHGTSSTGTCSACSADHKAGEHRDDAGGPSDACALCKGPTSSRRHAA